jgi:hypothetical protein
VQEKRTANTLGVRAAVSQRVAQDPVTTHGHQGWEVGGTAGSEVVAGWGGGRGGGL